MRLEKERRLKEIEERLAELRVQIPQRGSDGILLII
jgi:hypothetical protein